MKWILFGPEIYYLVVVIVFLFLAMMKPFDARRTHLTALILAALGVGVSMAAVRLTGGLFQETYHVDLFSQVC